MHQQHTDRVDVHEAARVTGLNPQTIYRLARVGRLRSYRVLNRSVRFDRTDLLALVRENVAVHSVAQNTPGSARVND
jgi:excisionase family DNA binding protein